MVWGDWALEGFKGLSRFILVSGSGGAFTGMFLHMFNLLKGCFWKFRVVSGSGDTGQVSYTVGNT